MNEFQKYPTGPWKTEKDRYVSLYAWQLEYMDHLLAERALLVTRAENAEAALAYAASTAGHKSGQSGPIPADSATHRENDSND